MKVFIFIAILVLATHAQFDFLPEPSGCEDDMRNFVKSGVNLYFDVVFQSNPLNLLDDVYQVVTSYVNFVSINPYCLSEEEVMKACQVALLEILQDLGVEVPDVDACRQSTADLQEYVQEVYIGYANGTYNVSDDLIAQQLKGLLAKETTLQQNCLGEDGNNTLEQEASDYDACLKDIVALVGVPVRDYVNMVENGYEDNDVLSNVQLIIAAFNDGARDCSPENPHNETVVLSNNTECTDLLVDFYTNQVNLEETLYYNGLNMYNFDDVYNFTRALLSDYMDAFQVCYFQDVQESDDLTYTQARMLQSNLTCAESVQYLGDEQLDVVDSVQNGDWVKVSEDLADLYVNRFLAYDNCESVDEGVQELVRYAVNHFAGGDSDADQCVSDLEPLYDMGRQLYEDFVNRSKDAFVEDVLNMTYTLADSQVACAGQNFVNVSQMNNLSSCVEHSVNILADEVMIIDQLYDCRLNTTELMDLVQDVADNVLLVEQECDCSGDDYPNSFKDQRECVRALTDILSKTQSVVDELTDERPDFRNLLQDVLDVYDDVLSVGDACQMEDDHGSGVQWYWY